MSKAQAFKEWVENNVTEKHLAGQHNQKRHGWRFGTLDAARRGMRGQDETERAAYRKAQAKRGGIEGWQSELGAKRPYQEPDKPKKELTQQEKIRKQADETPWELTPQLYQVAKGVKQPWIAEISPMQYARMSERQRAAYDKKRSEEWGASIAVKQEWRDKVISAFSSGRINDNTSMSADARSVISWHKSAMKKQAIDERVKRNKINSVNDIELGDRVYYGLYGKYGRVVKKFAKSVRVEWEEPFIFRSFGGPGKPDQITTHDTLDAKGFTWMNYNEARTAAEAGLPISPRD